MLALLIVGLWCACSASAPLAQVPQAAGVSTVEIATTTDGSLQRALWWAPDATVRSSTGATSRTAEGASASRGAANRDAPNGVAPHGGAANGGAANAGAANAGTAEGGARNGGSAAGGGAKDRQANGVPLLVALHTWNGDYRQEMSREYFTRCQRLGWACIHPDFRGKNHTPAACASDAAVQDVVDAVTYAQRVARIDAKRIYLAGVSGGGHMALIMAARHPRIWAGVTAWVPISDLAAWHKDATTPEFAPQLEAICGGPPGASAAVDAEYRRRSPLSILSQAAGVPLDLNVGIHDGWTGSVPVSHSLHAFNALARANGAPGQVLSDADITWITEKQDIPLSLRPSSRSTPVSDATYTKPVLFRREAGPARLTVFDGGHEMLHDAALTWLARQRKAQ